MSFFALIVAEIVAAKYVCFVALQWRSVYVGEGVPWPFNRFSTGGDGFLGWSSVRPSDDITVTAGPY